MNIPELFISIFAPHQCLSCLSEGEMLCESCRNLLPETPPRCFMCREPTIDWSTCHRCATTTKITRLVAGTAYQGVAKDLIWQLKMSGARSAAIVMAKKMATQIKNRDNLILVPVPTASSRVRLRGYDQATLLAKELSKQTGLPHVNLLARSGQMHQHGLSRNERITQLKQAYRVTHSHMAYGKYVVLIDDVVTTGATLEAAANALLAVGAESVSASVFAQPSLSRLVQQY